MSTTDFDPADARTWLARGREPVHAELLAAAWRDYPELDPDAPLDARMARTRARVAVLRPVTEEIRLRSEAARQATNFAFTAGRVTARRGDERDAAILRGRDLHGYDWDEAVQYSQGWFAAHAGWPARSPLTSGNGVSVNAAYEQGFADGGGDETDLFDAARRANAAAARSRTEPPLAHRFASPLPSQWAKPSDAPPPASWQRRLLILSPREAWASAEAGAFGGEFLRLLAAIPGARETRVVLIGREGFADATTAPTEPPTCPAERVTRLIGCPDQRTKLAALLVGCEIEDVLVAAQAHGHPIVHPHAAALPPCRAMARTRNTPLQEKAHFRLWLARGRAPGEAIGAGHIRWGKVAKGLTGKLGEFEASYAGPAEPKGHLIRITVGGSLALGYVDAKGAPLNPSVRVSSKAALRAAMADALRRFAGATRLAPAEFHRLPDPRARP